MIPFLKIELLFGFTSVEVILEAGYLEEKLATLRDFFFGLKGNFNGGSDFREFRTMKLKGI